jgi:hypothetical protein
MITEVDMEVHSGGSEVVDGTEWMMPGSVRRVREAYLE